MLLKQSSSISPTIDKNIYYPSRFKFLLEHHGIRKNCLHVLLAGTGKGKSSLLKAIIADCSRVAKVAVYLTEETQEEYEPMLQWCDPKKENIYYLEERKLGQKNDIERFIMFQDVLSDPEIEIVFFDNITTSRFYKSLKQQEEFVERLVSFVKSNKTIFAASHTQKNFKDNGHTLISGIETRGTNLLHQCSDFYYCMQSINVADKIFPILLIDKHRHIQVKDQYFLLGYDYNAYRFDQAIQFEEIKSIFKKRNTL